MAFKAPSGPQEPRVCQDRLAPRALLVQPARQEQQARQAQSVSLEPLVRQVQQAPPVRQAQLAPPVRPAQLAPSAKRATGTLAPPIWSAKWSSARPALPMAPVTSRSPTIRTKTLRHRPPFGASGTRWTGQHSAWADWSHRPGRPGWSSQRSAWSHRSHWSDWPNRPSRTRWHRHRTKLVQRDDQLQQSGQ